ncbi:unnamed protein product [Nesidiocoris tenuis]|uniref:Small integral membrane protein 4 n=1 Tax=Nesidiocoris tenuis TaxID=355587 RepID=A0A6H5GE47_9HEMI|nr:unnamed protein product [Nesidiocoris tenuis]
MKPNPLLVRLLNKWPGKKHLGIYRFMPLFFALGAGLEYTMINWDFHGQVNFYRTYKRRQAENQALELLRHPSTA